MENFRIFENGDGVASREGDKVGRLDEKMFRVAKVNRRRRVALSFCVFFFNQRKFKPRGCIISSTDIIGDGGILSLLFAQRVADVTSALEPVAMPSSIRPIHRTENLARAIDSEQFFVVLAELLENAFRDVLLRAFGKRGRSAFSFLFGSKYASNFS